MEDTSMLSLNDTTLHLNPSSRRSTPRVEKGVVKVIEHEVKEEAAVLLYACAEFFDHDNEVGKNAFRTHVLPKIQEVVNKFGLDHARIKGAGESMVNKIISEAKYSQALNDVKTQQAKVGMALRMMEERLLDDETPQNVDLSIIGNTRGEAGGTRSTRKGSAAKRAREQDELETAAAELVMCVKRLKNI